MSFKKSTDLAPIEVSEQLRESSKCPVCGKSCFDVLKRRLNEDRIRGPVIDIWCDNEDCSAHYDGFEVKLRVLILPLE